jgi:predicted cupin superfamily sugar epimerase
MQTSLYWIDKYHMLPHPEGGYYKELFRSELEINGGWGRRNALTSIFYLLEEKDYSAFHRIKSDELWYYHAGDTLLTHEINPSGELVTHTINAENPFAAITPGSWFASVVKDQKGYVLVSCAVAPGFDFVDFELAETDELAKEYPEHSSIINRLKRH